MKRITAITIVSALRAVEKPRDIYSTTELKLYTDLELLGLVHIRQAKAFTQGERRSRGAFCISGLGKSVVVAYCARFAARHSEAVVNSADELFDVFGLPREGKNGH